MHRILATSLLLSPLFLSAAAVASTPATDASTSTQVRPVSTGVIPAHVLYAPSISLSPSTAIPSDAAVVLHLNVDENGKAQGIQVVKSVNADLDARVVEAVRESRFRPAMLDKQVIPIDMNLTVVVQRHQ
jgi:protein TonB